MHHRIVNHSSHPSRARVRIRSRWGDVSGRTRRSRGKAGCRESCGARAVCVSLYGEGCEEGTCSRQPSAISRQVRLMIPDGYTDLGPGKIAAIVTYLEMLERPSRVVSDS